ncbi:hypothetical protein, partial [Rhizobium leguminosarum]|uniref:hypothetical protein n=1 Tax=Rhizobium leguminosarum TaxID=384 RepID=UPI0019807499
SPTNRSSEDMATEMLAEVRVQDPRMTRIPVAQPLYTATATYKDEALSGAEFTRNKSLWLKAGQPPAMRAAMLQLLRELGTIHEQDNHCIRGGRGSGRLRQTS